MKIYTKTGDDGTTGLFSGKRVSKDSSYIETYGTVDELNAFIGHAMTVCEDKSLYDCLLQIQHDLHAVCADLATPLDANVKIERIADVRARRLETWIDDFEKELQPLRQFILAGGSELASRIHIARTIARRAEREAVAHAQQVDANAETIIYLNRLSDFLFVLARVANHRLKVQDVTWDKNR